MSTHLTNLLQHVPELLTVKMLDIGSGKGKFLVEVTVAGGDIQGVELNPAYIAETHARATEANVQVRVVQGVAEALPFENDAFDFINIAEIIEHVESPDLLIAETYRVLREGGYVYLSVPSRYSLRDPHFHLYGVNLLPRAWSSRYIGLFGKHKTYGGEAGHQRLTDMHYYTYRAIVRRLIATGFTITDIREKKIRQRIQHPVLCTMACAVYRIIRPIYFDTFHFLLQK